MEVQQSLTSDEEVFHSKQADNVDVDDFGHLSGLTGRAFGFFESIFDKKLQPSWTPPTPVTSFEGKR
jgi:hypothetical protein